MNAGHLQIASILGAVGSGLIGGVFFAFSTFIMQALARMPAAQGIAAMQHINVTVLNPWFLGVFMGTGLISAGVIVLRRRQPNRPRGFRVPLVPFLPMLSIVSCLILMMSLPLETWVRFFVWLVIGLAIYFVYGMKRTASNG